MRVENDVVEWLSFLNKRKCGYGLDSSTIGTFHTGLEQHTRFLRRTNGSTFNIIN